MNFTKLKLMGMVYNYMMLIVADCNLGKQLALKLASAHTAFDEQSDAFTELSSSIDDNLHLDWLNMINWFHIDKTKPNPYMSALKMCKHTSLAHPGPIAEYDQRLHIA
jgi:hypothetical protein